MTAIVNITIEDTNRKGIYFMENVPITIIPNIGERFDLVISDYGHYEQFLNEQKQKGKLRVADVTHVYMEHDRSHNVNIVLAFSNDKRFEDKLWQE